MADNEVTPAVKKILEKRREELLAQLAEIDSVLPKSQVMSDSMSNLAQAHLNYVWNSLVFFASESVYTLGERTGGVLQGCPRNPPPTPAELAAYGRLALVSLCRYLGREPEEWMAIDIKMSADTLSDRVDMQTMVDRFLAWKLPATVSPDCGSVRPSGECVRAYDSGTNLLSATEAQAMLLHVLGKCTRPPKGWECSRVMGHTGPCAATPSGAQT